MDEDKMVKAKEKSNRSEIKYMTVETNYNISGRQEKNQEKKRVEGV